MEMTLRNKISFGFEQTFTVSDWWTKPGFCHVSDTPFKREKMLSLSQQLISLLNGHMIESKDSWGHLQYEIYSENDSLEFYVTMDPGCIEVKTAPKKIDDLKSYLPTLFDAAKKSDLLTYRSWWYGIKTGTEGGCHINMGSLSEDENIFLQEPDLLVKYSAYVHNRPFLSYPFMGVDVGPGGNAQRMDEKEDYQKTKKLFQSYPYSKLKNLDDVHNYFIDSSIISDRSSYPSLRKIKSPLSMIEDRAHESFDSTEQILLACELKLKVLSVLQEAKSLEKLKDFPNKHSIELTSFKLWEDFQNWCSENEMNPVDYQFVFDRQFPTLYMGKNAPHKFKLKEGKRPRKVLEVYTNKDGEITGKKIDTNFKRLEFYYNTLMEEQFEFEVEYEGLEDSSTCTRHNGYLGFGEKGTSYYKYVDFEILPKVQVMKIRLIDKLTKSIIEETSLDLKQMMFV